jgi:hypothetical protein
VVAHFDSKVKPNSWPEHEIAETAGAIWPKNAAGSVDSGAVVIVAAPF